MITRRTLDPREMNALRGSISALLDAQNRRLDAFTALAIEPQGTLVCDLPLLICLSSSETSAGTVVLSYTHRKPQ